MSTGRRAGPPPSSLAAPDPSREQINALAGAAGLGQEEFWSAIRIIDWLCRNNEEIEVDFLAANLEEAGLLRKTETENWRKFFLEAMVAVPPAYLRRSTISGIMTTFRSVEYACDLRLDPDDRTLPPIPVCVVRIQNDEGEPLIFQCAPVDLDRLIEVLRDARGIFSQTISKES